MDKKWEVCLHESKFCSAFRFIHLVKRKLAVIFIREIEIFWLVNLPKHWRFIVIYFAVHTSWKVAIIFGELRISCRSRPVGSQLLNDKWVMLTTETWTQLSLSSSLILVLKVSILATLQIDKSRVTYEELCTTLNSYFDVLRNLIVQRACFNKQHQLLGEPMVLSFKIYTGLQKTEYGSLKDNLIRDSHTGSKNELSVWSTRAE